MVYIRKHVPFKFPDNPDPRATLLRWLVTEVHKRRQVVLTPDSELIREAEKTLTQR